MKADELRIGNWWSNGTKEYIADVSTIYDCYMANEDGNVVYESIPLTKEWLVKFGWSWNKECNSYERVLGWDARMNLSYSDVSISYTMFNYITKAMICNEIRYVHQLQNLYFALTGEELTIK